MIKPYSHKIFILLLIIVAFSIAGIIYLVTLNTNRRHQTSAPTPSPTPSPATTPISEKFAAYGDSRTGHDIHQLIVNHIISYHPKAVFHVGDLVEDGTKADQWQIFNQITAPIKKILYPALGNHDNNADLYYKNFQLPNNEQWYLVKFSTLNAIILDSNAPLSKNSPQYLWLIQTLSQLDKTKFTLVVFHHPPFSSGPHIEDEKGLRNSIVPLFENYGVDLIFNGHDHDYERSYVNGIYYIVVGSSGAPLYSKSRTRSFSQKFLKSYSFATFKISGQKMVLSVYNQNNKLIDFLTLANR